MDTSPCCYFCSDGDRKNIMSNAVQRVAHRGGAALAPENTLAAFRNALNFPVDAIELDVHMSCDGQAIVFHDYTVNKRTNGHGNILDLDFAYLRSLNAAAHFPGGWPQPEQIPTLREVLDLARGHVQVYIEIKQSKRGDVYASYPHIAEAVIADVRAADMLDQVLVMSFDWSVLPQIKELELDVQTGALVSDERWKPQAEHALDTLIEQVTALGCNWINMDAHLFTADMAGAAHQHRFQLGVWTVNSVYEMHRFIKAGVDSITSDRPDLFAAL
jgi:glycerophosphoryl diester phosphodiesterase